MNDIDLVIPMVFPADPEWQREYTNATGKPEATSNVRYRSWGTEELLIKCCKKYMPWLRIIHILLFSESQVQPWMERDPRLHIVFHRDFILRRVSHHIEHQVDFLRGNVRRAGPGDRRQAKHQGKHKAHQFFHRYILLFSCLYIQAVLFRCLQTRVSL